MKKLIISVSLFVVNAFAVECPTTNEMSTSLIGRPQVGSKFLRDRDRVTNLAEMWRFSEIDESFFDNKPTRTTNDNWNGDMTVLPGKKIISDNDKSIVCTYRASKYAIDPEKNVTPQMSDIKIVFEKELLVSQPSNKISLYKL